jgi:hypothetical protein
MGVNSVNFKEDGRVTVPLFALSENALEQLAEDPENVPEEILQRLSRNRAIRFRIAVNSKTPESILALMVKEIRDDLEDMENKLAKNPCEGDRRLMAERRRDDFRILKDIAKNPASSRKIIRDLMSFPELHLSIAANPGTPTEFLDEIYKYRKNHPAFWREGPYSLYDLCECLAANPHSSDQLLESVLKDVDFNEDHCAASPKDQALQKRVASLIARNPGTPTKLLCAIVGYYHNNDYVVSLAILNPNRSAEMLQKIYEDDSSLPVQALIAMCLETPTNILTELSEHNNPTISRIARETLKSKSQ